MAAVGSLLLIFSTLKSEFILYRLLVARSRISMGDGDKVHRFYQLSGLTITILGILWALDIIWGLLNK